MAQTDNPFLDGVAKAFTDAAGMAQSVRAILLASATAASFFGRRASRLISQGEARPAVAKRMTAVAPSMCGRPPPLQGF